jgi:type IV pilus assembly protein PilY1
MNPRTRRNLVLALLIGVLLPLYGTADAPVPIPPASDATCCNLAGAYTSALFPGGNGDEGFFGLPVGVPANALILLDNSGSMMELPNNLTITTPPAEDTGTCAGTSLDAVAGTAEVNDHTPPYDNGTTNTFVVDAPPWGLSTCSTNGDTCLFAPDRYYKATYPSSTGGTVDGRDRGWTSSSAPSFATGNSNTQHICYGAPSNCQTCLDTKGYYIWVASSGWPRRHLYFKGSFLNRNPPKFVTARKVVKDLLAIDATLPDESASVRFGLAVFTSGDYSSRQNGLDAEDGAQLVVPLGPNCDNSASGFQNSNTTVATAYKAARQAIVNAINDPTKVNFNSWTPLGESLFNIGQYFSDTRGTTSIINASGPAYDYMFGTQWTRASFYETAAGTANASWVSSGRQASVCWHCQQSSAIIITDGEPTNDSNVPRYWSVSSHTMGPTPGTAATSANNDFRNWTYSGLTVPCSPANSTECRNYILQKVAYFLNHNDIRKDLSNEKQIQNVVTYAISFGIKPTDDGNRRALSLLAKAAELGGGQFFNTSSGEELEMALRSAVGDTIARATSFSVANTNTLQTGNNNQLFLARFRKMAGVFWEGHLHRFRVFNEYVQGCDSKKLQADQPTAKCKMPNGSEKDLPANLNEDVYASGKAICDGLFILDKECNVVAEDKNGTFRKATLDSSTKTFKADESAPLAVPFWDAGENLSYETFPAAHPDAAKAGKANAAYRTADEHDAKKRVIYTVLDADGDGKFTAADGRTEFEAKNAAAIAPLLELNGNVTIGAQGVNFCLHLLERTGMCGDSPLPACPVPDANNQVAAASIQTCAEQVIHFVRGWDVLDHDGDGCAGPGNPSNDASCPGATLQTDGVTMAGGQDGEERIRGLDASGNEWDAREVDEFWKLGDIFHSAPVMVRPPVHEVLCDLALDNQCVSTLHSPKGFSTTVQTPVDYDIDGDGEIELGENAYEAYRQAHADRRQIVLVGANDGMLHAFDAGEVDSSEEPDALGTYPYTVGDGAELWAFIPPDLLPKLKLMLTEHHYFVDGNTMVRDVWNDDDKDGKKDPGEFRTMAVLSERAGGTQYVGLDVTDPTDPKFRWSFPENCTIDQSIIGQSWSGFAPRPPPIGPVKHRVRSGYADPKSRGFEERWIVVVNGGYDPTLTRGRGIWMLDVWTGQVVWRFTDDDLKDQIDADASMWSVPAAVGMLDVGDADEAILDGDGFFDTATWGDMGGQLFVARFQTVGTLNATTKRIDNWWAARAFEEQRQTTDAQFFQGRSEFFHMTANVVDLDTGFVHSYLGSGNREHLLQTGAACGPGNILGCCQAGCNAEMFTKYNYGGCNVVNHVKCSSGKMVQYKSKGADTTCDESYACGKMEANIQLHLQCGTAGNPADIIAHLNCDHDGNCVAREDVKDGKPVKIEKLTAPNWHNRFYGIWSFGGSDRLFGSQTTAQTFDVNRFTDVDYSGTCAGTPGDTCTLVNTTQANVNSAGGITCASGTTCSATGYDPGWYYEYGRRCPSGTCEDSPPWLDEKTASGATVLAGCVDWNSFRPRSTTAPSDPCSNVDTSAARNYTYLADFITGAPSPSCGFEYADSSGKKSYVRARPRTTIAPPPDPTQLVAVGMDGEVKYLAAQIEPGGTPSTTALGETRELMTPAYWLEVNRELHVCRHVDNAQCR